MKKDKVWIKGKIHVREENLNVIRYYYKNRAHREDDGPAIIYKSFNNVGEWYKNGQLHRENGPAVEYTDGNKEWWIEGLQYSEAEFDRIINEKG